MHSKWLDLATEIAAFHYQSRRYDAFKPPAFGANPEVQNLDVRESDISRLTNSGLHMSTVNQRGSDPHMSFDDTLPSVSVSEKESLPTALPLQKKYNRQNISRNGLIRHAKSPTMMDLMQEMDDSEAKQTEMRKHNAMEVNDYYTESSGRSHYTSGSEETSTKGSWLKKIRERRSEAKLMRKLAKEEKHRNQSDSLAESLPMNLNNVKGIHRTSNAVNLSGRDTRVGRQTPRRRTRHTRKTAIQNFYSKRKSIARTKASALREGQQLEFRDRFDSKTGKPYSLFTAVSRKHLREGNLDPDSIPPLLFLEECAHLMSLMSAVAFSTLRNDLPEAESPLTVFEPGLPWPHVDPDSYRGKVRKGWYQSKFRVYAVLQYILGRSRNDKARTLYNAARPFRVIGNVSDAEIEKLQEARGPLAKVTLVSMWLLELISREYQAGSTGDVAPPIISRIYQFVSDGLAGYNQARKIAYIPFPFPHAQITTLFMLVVDFLVTPMLMSTYVTNGTLGFFLNFASVMCFTGLHEVAREIENPFQNVPNDVPLNNYQAQFNEGLMVMFYGYHPDAYWNNGTSERKIDPVLHSLSSQKTSQKSDIHAVSDGRLSASSGSELPKNNASDPPRQQENSQSVPRVSFQSSPTDTSTFLKVKPFATSLMSTITEKDSKSSDDLSPRRPDSHVVDVRDISIESELNNKFHQIPIGMSVREEEPPLKYESNKTSLTRTSDVMSSVGSDAMKTDSFLHHILSSTEHSSDSVRSNQSVQDIPKAKIGQVPASRQFRIPNRSSMSSNNLPAAHDDFFNNSLIFKNLSEEEDEEEL